MAIANDARTTRSPPSSSKKELQAQAKALTKEIIDLQGKKAKALSLANLLEKKGRQSIEALKIYLDAASLISDKQQELRLLIEQINKLPKAKPKSKKVADANQTISFEEARKKKIRNMLDNGEIPPLHQNPERKKRMTTDASGGGDSPPPVSESKSSASAKSEGGTKSLLWVLGGLVIIGLLVFGGVKFIPDMLKAKVQVATPEQRISSLEDQVYDLKQQAKKNEEALKKASGQREVVYVQPYRPTAPTYRPRTYYQPRRQAPAVVQTQPQVRADSGLQSILAQQRANTVGQINDFGRKNNSGGTF